MWRKKINMVTAVPLLALLIILAASGCGSSPAADHGGAEPLAITLRAAFADHRFTYFELRPDGELRYGGGANAANRIGKPVGNLTAEQRAELRRIITEHNLLKARGSHFKTPQRVRWNVTLRVGGDRRTFECVDDDVPGVETLHDTLFQMQKSLHYAPGRYLP